MRILNSPALLVAATLTMLVCVGITVSAQAPPPPNAINLAGPTDVDNSNPTVPHTFASKTLDLTCPASGVTAALSSTADGAGNILVDNYIAVTVTHDSTIGPLNVCTGADTTPGSWGNNCFNLAYQTVAGSFQGQNPDDMLNANPGLGVPPINLQTANDGGPLLFGGQQSVKVDEIDYGGKVAGSSLYLITNCSETQATVPPGDTGTVDFQGGPDNGGYDYEVTNNNDNAVTVNVTPIVTDQTTCNSYLQNHFPGASCFVYDNANGTNSPGVVMFELTCPAGSSPDGTCGDASTAFDAFLASQFSFSKANNLTFRGAAHTGNPFPGWLKGVGLDPLHPCTPDPGNIGGLFQSNQVDLFQFDENDPLVRGGSGGTGSCWVATYNQPDEQLSDITINTSPTYTQNSLPPTTYKCATPASSHLPEDSTNQAGPYLSVASCQVTQGATGSSCSPADSSGMNCNATVDTSTVGVHTFSVTATDTGGNSSSKSVNYTVLNNSQADLAILKVGPLSVKTGGTMTYAIGITNFGSNPTDGPVTVTDALPAGVTYVANSAKGNQESCSIVNRRLACTVTPLSCTFSSGVVTCTTPGPVAPLKISSLNGATMQITVNVTAASGTTIQNTATVSGFNVDSNSHNNSSTASTKVK